MMIRLICVAIGYVFGLFQTSYIYGKMHGIDIRTQGSGNAGTTNALRVLGKKAGAITFLGDALKCVAAVLLVQALFGASHGDIRPLLAIYAGAGVVLGHNFPFYLGFKGGKGIAASAGMMLAFGHFPIFAVSALAFILVFTITNDVSLGSMVLYLCFLVQVIFLGQRGEFGMSQGHLTELYIVAACLTALAFWQHRTNIGRLIHGTENKTYLLKKKTKGEN